MTNHEAAFLNSQMESGTVLYKSMLEEENQSVFSCFLPLPASALPTNIIQNLSLKISVSCHISVVSLQTSEGGVSLLLPSVHLSCVQVLCCHHSLFTPLIIMKHHAPTGLYSSCGYEGSKLVVSHLHTHKKRKT